MAIELSQLADNQSVKEALNVTFDLALDTSLECPAGIIVVAPERYSPFGSDASGGLFLQGEETGHILHLTSEGQAGVLSANLEEFLRLLLAHPDWRDLLKFSGGGQLSEMRRVASLLKQDEGEYRPKLEEHRALLGQSLLPPVYDDPIQALHAAMTGLVPAPRIQTPDGYEYEILFNRFTADDNPMWRGRVA